jgi:hypothetical protein
MPFLVYTTMHRNLKAYCAILVGSSNFRYQASPSVSPRESTQRREMSGNFAEMTTSTPFMDFLHKIKLRHGTDGFISPPKEGVLGIFSP